jgi:hydroxyacylglutathione hydrolase
MQIHRLPALQDNYIFLLHDADRHIAAVVDPAEPYPVLRQIKVLEADLVAIFNTHHHGDHVGANADLLQRFPAAVVYAGIHDRGRIPGQTRFLQAGDRVTFGEHQAEVLFVPGHTRGHIAYYFPPGPADPAAGGDLFCGDTLFAGSCGRLFEGTPAQMVASLDQFRHLPDQTRVWCAHEYTLNNLKFALTVDPENRDLQLRFQQVQAARRRGEATIPTTIGLERRTNPFLRWDQPVIQRAMQQSDPVLTFAALRRRKDVF